MRILHIVHSVRNVGNGIVNVAVDLACGQALLGHSVAVASEGGEYRELLARTGVRCFDLKHGFRPNAVLQSVVQFHRIVKTWEPEIVHVHIMSGALLSFALRLGRRYRIVSTAHTAFRRSAVLMGLADRVIAVSDADAVRLRSLGVKNVTVIHNAPLGSPRKVALADVPPAPLARPSITTVAGLYFRKGIDVLLSAFERVHQTCPEAHLYVVGAGPDRDAFLDQTKRSGARQNIHFAGFQSDPQPYLLASDIFVLASRHDPFPLVIAEARAAGCAVVASDVDGIPETLDRGAAGILVRPGDAQHLATALEILLRDRAALERQKTLALQGLERYEGRRMIADTGRVYEAVLRRS